MTPSSSCCAIGDTKMTTIIGGEGMAKKTGMYSIPVDNCREKAVHVEKRILVMAH